MRRCCAGVDCFVEAEDALRDFSRFWNQGRVLAASNRNLFCLSLIYLTHSLPLELLKSALGLAHSHHQPSPRPCRWQQTGLPAAVSPPLPLLPREHSVDQIINRRLGDLPTLTSFLPCLPSHPNTRVRKLSQRGNCSVILRYDVPLKGAKVQSGGATRGYGSCFTSESNDLPMDSPHKGSIFGYFAAPASHTAAS
jgi:hypothetical protein